MFTGIRRALAAIGFAAAAASAASAQIPAGVKPTITVVDSIVGQQHYSQPDLMLALRAVRDAAQKEGKSGEAVASAAKHYLSVLDKLNEINTQILRLRQEKPLLEKSRMAEKLVEQIDELGKLHDVQRKLPVTWEPFRLDTLRSQITALVETAMKDETFLLNSTVEVRSPESVYYGLLLRGAVAIPIERETGARLFGGFADSTTTHESKWGIYTQVFEIGPNMFVLSDLLYSLVNICNDDSCSVGHVTVDGGKAVLKIQEESKYLELKRFLEERIDRRKPITLIQKTEYEKHQKSILAHEGAHVEQYLASPSVQATLQRATEQYAAANDTTHLSTGDKQILKWYGITVGNPQSWRTTKYRMWMELWAFYAAETWSAPFMRYLETNYPEAAKLSKEMGKKSHVVREVPAGWLW